MRREIDPKGGYAWVQARSPQFTNNGGWVREHHWVWFKKFGQKVPRGWVLHHVDGVKTNNRLGNLQLMTFAAHTALHSTGRKQTKESREKQRTAMRLVTSSPEARARLSRASKKGWKEGRHANRGPISFETREKLSSSVREAWASGRLGAPAMLANKSRAMKKVWRRWKKERHLRNGIEVA